MSSGYTEDKQVEQPAIDLFQQLNWKTYNAYEEVLGEEGDLSRETTEGVVLAWNSKDCNPFLRGGIMTRTV